MSDDIPPNIKILVIEDEPNTRRLIVQLLKQVGIKNVYEASDGRAAYMETVRIQPHVVLCDIHMRPMGGLDYLVKIREMDALKSLPVIMLTADGSRDSVMTAMRHQIAGYLVKPVSAATLKKRIQAALAQPAREGGA